MPNLPRLRLAQIQKDTATMQHTRLAKATPGPGSGPSPDTSPQAQQQPHSKPAWWDRLEAYRFVRRPPPQHTHTLVFGLTDADWAGDQEKKNRRSTSGYVFYMAGAPISSSRSAPWKLSTSPLPPRSGGLISPHPQARSARHRQQRRHTHRHPLPLDA